MCSAHAYAAAPAVELLMIWFTALGSSASWHSYAHGAASSICTHHRRHQAHPSHCRSALMRSHRQGRAATGAPTGPQQYQRCCPQYRMRSPSLAGCINQPRDGGGGSSSSSSSSSSSEQCISTFNMSSVYVLGKRCQLAELTGANKCRTNHNETAAGGWAVSGSHAVLLRAWARTAHRLAATCMLAPDTTPRSRPTPPAAALAVSHRRNTSSSCFT